jgi:hypothetical protein
MQLRSGRSISKKVERSSSSPSLLMEFKNMTLRSGRVICEMKINSELKMNKKVLLNLINNRVKPVIQIQNDFSTYDDGIIYYVDMSRAIIELYSFINDHFDIIIASCLKKDLKTLVFMFENKAKEFLSNKRINELSKFTCFDGKIAKNCILELKKCIKICNDVSRNLM